MQWKDLCWGFCHLFLITDCIVLSQEKGLISKLRTYEINEVPSYRKSLLLDKREIVSWVMLTCIFWVSSGHIINSFSCSWHIHLSTKDRTMQHHQLEKCSSFIVHFVCAQLIYLFSGADSLDREDSLSNQEQGHTATSISEAYGVCTAAVKVRAHFKIFHHCRSLPSCNSMKHCILTCK